MYYFKSFIFFILVVTFTNSAHASKTWHHKDMAALALTCASLYSQSTSIPTECPESITNNLEFNLDNIEMDSLSESNIRKAVIWADDPLNEISIRNLFGLTRFAYRLAVSECNDKKNGLVNGLSCSSHYGPLQFLHAMEKDEQVAPTETQNKILDWIAFAYEIAADKSGKITSEKFCDYFKNNPSSIQPFFYEGDGAFPCGTDGNGRKYVKRDWRVATIFSFKCGFTITSCWEKLDPQVARRNAIGAILHVIQDSYAKGHTRRGDCCSFASTKEDLQLTNCAPIQQFLSYEHQNKKTHEKADKEFILTACKDPQKEEKDDLKIYDPIIASAAVLWHLQHDKSSTELITYLKNHVFRLDTKRLESGPGWGFSKLNK